jgi:hypothetical protein
MNALRITDDHEWRFNGRQWWLHFLPSDTPDEPLRVAHRFEAELLNAAKREVEAARAQAATSAPKG